MVLPNFLIIGAAKGGTTSLYTWLAQHPQIYMTPVKEPNFFALQGENFNYPSGTVSQRYLDECVTNFEAYLEQFKAVNCEIAIGEASPFYLYHPQAASRIQQTIPDVKLIAILRDPVERAYSNFLHHIREGFETVEDFSQALQAEESRMRDRWWWGFY
ncbi:MAG: sulfotransferase, partial [Cyanobacteriota bacterium]|nr:sulfotransferase [Cyanobacteriota bacterium]